MEFEIFRTGTHTSSNGISKKYTIEDLDYIAKSYNPEISEAPVVIGHPKDNSPAFGWIQSVKRIGDKLFAKAKDLLPEFVELLKKGTYKKRSISLDKEGKLVHVGFLGGKAPAVKGLADIKFSEADLSDSYEFSEVNFNEDEIQKDENVNSDMEKSDLPSNSDIQVNLSNHDILSNFDNHFNPDNNSTNFSSILYGINELKTTFNKFINNRNFATSEDDIKQAQERISELTFNIRVNEFELYLNEKLAYGTLTPAIKTKILDLLNFFKKSNFSSEELDEYFTLFTSFVDSFPRMISFDDFAGDEKEKANHNIDEFKNFTLDKQSELIHKEAMKLVDSENISYSEAVNKIIYSK